MTKLNITKLALLGATALLGAASAQAQVADSWTVGDSAVGSFNNSADGTTLQSSGGDTASTTSASIAGGERNSISASAVGASGSVGFNINNMSGADSSATLTTGALTVTGGNNSAVTNNGDIATPSIAGGDSNSISRAAVGSSASASFTTNAFNGSSETSSVTVGDSIIQSGDGTSTVAGGTDIAGTGGNAQTVNLTMTTIDTPDIAGGNQNSISASAVGSSASFSVANNAYDSSIDNTFTTGAVTVTSSNSSDGAITADAGGDVIALASPTIEAGDQNSISVNAIGASGSVSYASNYYGDGTNGANITTTGTIGDVSVTTYNGGAVVNTTDMSTPTIQADANNSSIGVAGIGTSASMSFASNDFTAGTATSTGSVTAGAVTLSALNEGGVTVGSSMDTPAIAGGLNNSISTSAVGASASLSFSNFTH